MIDPQYLERIGVFVAPDGQYKRYRTRIENAEIDTSDLQSQITGRLAAYDLMKVPHPVILPLATDKASLEEGRRKAVQAQADFYHPQHGWLRWGRKRETEAPENMGAGAVVYERERVTVRQEPRPDPTRDPRPYPDPDTEPEDEPGTEPVPAPAPTAKGR